MTTLQEAYKNWQIEDSGMAERSHKVLSIPQANTGFIPSVFFPSHTYAQGSRWGHVLIKNAYLALQHSSRLVGWHTTGLKFATGQENKKIITLNWSSRHKLGEDGQRLHIEHGWLPRWTYQISPSGSNGTSHIARSFGRRSIDEINEKELDRKLHIVKNMFAIQNRLLNIETLISKTSQPFVLCAFQLASDENLKHSKSMFADFYSPHKDGNLILAKALRDYIYSINPSLAVIFKQHPVDRSDFSNFSIRDGDLFIDNKMDITTNEIFASGQCKLAIAINSNTLHEASVWDVPCVSLGAMVWEEGGISARPYVRELSEGLDIVFRADLGLRDQDRKTVLRLYLQHLFENQWGIDDLLDPVKVNELLESMGTFMPNSFNNK